MKKEHKKTKIYFVWFIIFSFILIFTNFYETRVEAASVPMGYFDGVINGGSARGWALDPDSPSNSVYVHFYIDAPAGAGGKYIGYTLANVSRPDVNQATGYPGNHGFAWTIPQEYTTAYRYVFAYGIDITGDSNQLLTSSPKTVGVKPNGNSQISAIVGGYPLVIKTAEWLAGAIGSLTWKGKEFIDSYENGRQLQSASSFNGWRECFNPTESGSSADGKGPTSTSLLQALSASNNILTTQTQMAFWAPPGGKTEFCPTGAINNYPLSTHILNKNVVIGFQGMEHVIQYLVSFTVPEQYDSAIFEALTGYMPPEFSTFWTYDPLNKILSALSRDPGEQAMPIIFSTPDNNYAMGIYSPGLPNQYLGYGRWDFSNIPNGPCVKWNCVFRRNLTLAGVYNFPCYLIVGTLNDVTDSMSQVYSYLKGDVTPPPTPRVVDEGSYTSKSDQLYASWTSSDPESGIAEYQYKITQDSATSGIVVRDWTSTGTTPYVTAGGLSLTLGKAYYFKVKAKNKAGLWSQVGNSDGITVDSLPQLGSIRPASGLSLAGTAVKFIATYSDPDGWQNIQYAHLLVNTTSTTKTNCLLAYYDQNANKLYLRDNTNTSWLGGYAPGSAYIIGNTYAKLDCSKTTISGSGTTLTINWNVTFKSTFKGTKNTYLKVTDDFGAVAGFTQKGTWTIQ